MFAPRIPHSPHRPFSLSSPPLSSSFLPPLSLTPRSCYFHSSFFPALLLHLLLLPPTSHPPTHASSYVYSTHLPCLFTLPAVLPYSIPRHSSPSLHTPTSSFLSLPLPALPFPRRPIHLILEINMRMQRIIDSVRNLNAYIVAQHEHASRH